MQNEHIENAVATAEWMRLPKSGPDPVFGLSRGTYYNLIGAGAIRTSCIRRPGAITGIRLVHVASVRAYIEKHADGGR